MLTDAFSDFTYFVKNADADIPKLLAMLEDDLVHYSAKFFGYAPHVFPLLRKAARRYAEGKLSWRALHAIRIRLDLCYLTLEDTEELLIEDLRAYVRAQPTINLRTKVGKICRARHAASKRRTDVEARSASTVKAISPAAQTAVTTTGGADAHKMSQITSANTPMNANLASRLVCDEEDNYVMAAVSTYLTVVALRNRKANVDAPLQSC